MDSGRGQATVSQNEMLQNRLEFKNHVETIISENWKQTMYSRPSVIRRLNKSSGVDTNVISWALSDNTGLQHESKGGWDSRALSFPLNIQEGDHPGNPLPKKKLENRSGHVLLHGKGNASQTTHFDEPTSSKHKDEDEGGHLSLRRKRTITQARAGESDQGKDETSVFKLEGRNVYCPSYYRKRTLTQANIGDDNTVFKQALTYPSSLYGKRSKRQAFPATPWSLSQKEDENKRRTSFKVGECGACAQVRHLLWMHGKRTIPECPSVSAAFKQEEKNWKIPPPSLIMYRDQSIHQGGLGETYQTDGCHAFKQETENTAGNAQWCSSRKKKTIKATSIEETSVNQIEEGSSEYEDEGGIGRLPWLNRKKTAKPFHDDIDEKLQRKVESEATKKQDKETTAHIQWPNGKRTIKRFHDIGETQQRELESEATKKQYKETTAHLQWPNGKRTVKRFHDVDETQENVIEKLPNDQRKVPDEYKETDTLDYDPRRSRKVDHGAPSYSKDYKPMRQHAVGCSNVSGGFTGITGSTCPICYKTMSRAYHLKSHILIHTGEKPFKCAYCSKSFNQIGNRNAHQRIHTGEKPYACEHCGKRFVFVSSKHNHLKIHLLMRQERHSLPTQSI